MFSLLSWFTCGSSRSVVDVSNIKETLIVVDVSNIEEKLIPIVPTTKKYEDYFLKEISESLLEESQCIIDEKVGEGEGEGDDGENKEISTILKDSSIENISNDHTYTYFTTIDNQTTIDNKTNK